MTITQSTNILPEISSLENLWLIFDNIVLKICSLSFLEGTGRSISFPKIRGERRPESTLSMSVADAKMTTLVEDLSLDKVGTRETRD